MVKEERTRFVPSFLERQERKEGQSSEEFIFPPVQKGGEVGEKAPLLRTPP